jgi:CO dehydrogenase maturation factor
LIKTFDSPSGERKRRMSYLIAITGKGGVGKTTIAALLIDRLIKRGCKPVLAVDADPNTCLDAALGVSVAKTVGGVREEAREIAGKGMAAGISKQELLEMKIAHCMVEADDFDLIAMGRPEGPGCYFRLIIRMWCWIMKQDWKTCRGGLFKK